MCTLLRAVAADFFFNCRCLEIRLDNTIRHIPRYVHYHAQGLRFGNVLEFLCWKWKPSPRVVLIYICEFYCFVESFDFRPSNQGSLCFCFINVFVVSCVIFLDNLCYPLSLNLTQQGNPNSTDRCRSTTQGKYGLCRCFAEWWGRGWVVKLSCARLRGGVCRASSFVYQHNIIKEFVYTYTVDKVDLQPLLGPLVHSFTSARMLG
jgi:hypothetical protein